MAFIFNPNPSEGDKQTNPDTGIEYVYSNGAWRALGPRIEDEFDTLDERYVKLTGTSRLTGSWRIKGDNEAGDGEQTFQSISGGYQKLYHIQTPEDRNTGWVANVEYVQQKIDAIPPVDLDGYATESYVDDAIAAIPNVDLDGYATETYVDEAIENINLTGKYLPITGGTLTGSLKVQRGDEKTSPQFKIAPNGSTDYATSIYSLNNGQMRLRTSHTESESGHIGSHIILDPNGGVPETKIYHLVTPTREDHAANKEYVDNAVTAVSAGPASLAWEWRNYDSLFDPGEGKVAWYGNGSAYRLNYKTANGIDLGKNKLGTKDETFSNKPHLGIWTYVNNGWQLIKLLDIKRMQWNKENCIFIYPDTVNFGTGPANNFTAGQKYYFTVGGFF